MKACPKVPDLATRTENGKYYSFLLLGAILSIICSVILVCLLPPSTVLFFRECVLLHYYAQSAFL